MSTRRFYFGEKNGKKNTSFSMVIFSRYVSLNILGMLGLSLYILTDTFFVANGLGADGLAALNLAIPVYSFISGMGQMIGLGGATRYSINQGKLGKDASHVFSQVVNFVILAAIPLVMLAMLAGSFANIILDYVFIFPLQMGMFGAVLATGLAPIISMLVLSHHFIKGHNTFRFVKTRIFMRELLDIASLGDSLFITEVSSGVVMIVNNTVILAQQGYIGVAAYGIIANISLVVIGLFNGIAQGMQPLLSQNYGQGNAVNVKKVHRYGLTTSTVLALIVYLCLIIWDDQVVSAFNSERDPLLAQTAIYGLRIYFTALVFVGYNVISSIYFGSIEQPKAAFIISGNRGLVVIIPVILVLSKLWGMTGVWLAFPVTELITAVITYHTKAKVAAPELKVSRA